MHWRGDRTLLDNTIVFAHTEAEFAKFHTIDNLPMMTAGIGGMETNKPIKEIAI